ncbi:MAG: phosphoglycerate kinase [Candidatus Kerfeldbacteria bacterium]
MDLKIIQGVEVENKKVLIRCGFDVPFDDDGEIVNDERIKECIPSIKYLVEKKAKVIICAHNGRPNGKIIPKLSMEKVGMRLEKLLGLPINRTSDCVGLDVLEVVNELKSGEILLLENLRFHIEEKDNDEGFAKELADLADIYVNDAFANSHREHASMTGVTKFLPSYAGFRLQKEIEVLSEVLDNPARPLVAVIGGVKISDKIKVIKKFLKIADHVLIGGALANTILKAKGISIGKSIVEDEMIDYAKELLLTDTNFHLPVDVVVASMIDKDAETEIKAAGNVDEHEYILDIGPDTIKLYEDILESAKTIVWGGPMGYFELKPFSEGTIKVAKAVSNSKAMSVVGGGDTMEALDMAGSRTKIDFISTGGGAMLKFLESSTLPALKILLK